MTRRLLPVAVALLFFSIPGAAFAQQADDPPPTREEQRLARQDSIRALMNERLLLLGRGPGADSATIAADSARLAPSRRGGPEGPAFQPIDSVAEALLAMPGYVPTRYVGTEAVYDRSSGQLALLGDSATRASWVRDGSRLEADEQLLYDEKNQQVRTVGVATISPPQGDPTTAEGMIVDTESELATALGAKTVLRQSAEWYMDGNLPIVWSEGGYGHDLEFTTCENDEPHYHFRASEVKWLRGADSVLVARNVTLRFAEVPVLWLPFFAQNIGSGRRSGLLTPTFSVNDIVRQSGSYQRRLSNLGYYWAISDYMDASLALDWFSGNFTALTGGFQYNWRRQFLSGNFNARRFWEADGGRQFGLSTSHNWQISERTKFRLSASYATSTAFINRNSFDPREVTGSIDSQGGLDRRFDWGQFSINGNRRQFLNDDRVETRFPEASLSLNTRTLFPASPGQAKWYNNMAWGGNVRFSSRGIDRAQTGAYVPGQEDVVDLSGSATTSLTLGRLSIGPQVNFTQGTRKGIPFDSLPFFADLVAEQGGGALGTAAGRAAFGVGPFADAMSGDLVDVTRTQLDWSLGMSYQQTLVASTTFTPTVSLSGSLLRSDTVDVAQDFVSAPTRVSVGAELRGDLFGFFPGFAGFSQIRHKVSPGVNWSYAPETTPTDLQTRVFGGGVTREQNLLGFSLNQTFEAKRRPREVGDSASSEGQGPQRPRSRLIGRDEEFEKLEQGEVVQLLALRTSAISYDLVQADSLGRFIDGFRTVSLSNTLSSDLLAGLSVQMQHDLFGTDDQGQREFAPKLTRLNFGFNLDDRSSIWRLFGFGGGDEEEKSEEDPSSVSVAPDSLNSPTGEDAFLAQGPDEGFGFEGTEATIVPGGEGPAGQQRQRSGGGAGVGRWSAGLQYALTRNREGIGSQVVSGTLRLQPTEKWTMSWRTGFDIDTGSFNDHTIRLTRDLHRWDANFDFVQTATGNWTFRFEVRLSDQQDLKFDYEQRSLQQGPDFFRGFPGN